MAIVVDFAKQPDPNDKAQAARNRTTTMLFHSLFCPMIKNLLNIDKQGDNATPTDTDEDIFVNAMFNYEHAVSLLLLKHIFGEMNTGQNLIAKLMLASFVVEKEKKNG